MQNEWQRENFVVSTDPARLDLEVIANFLQGTYWASHRSRSLIEKSLDRSLCFGLYHAADQIGFGRAVTDCATYAYLADVFVLPAYRKRGLGRWLVECILGHPELKDLRRWCLLTQDAHELYRPLGFRDPANPSHYLELVRPTPPAAAPAQSA